MADKPKNVIICPGCDKELSDSDWIRGTIVDSGFESNYAWHNEEFVCSKCGTRFVWRASYHFKGADAVVDEYGPGATIPEYDEDENGDLVRVN